MRLNLQLLYLCEQESFIRVSYICTFTGHAASPQSPLPPHPPFLSLFNQKCETNKTGGTNFASVKQAHVGINPQNQPNMIARNDAQHFHTILTSCANFQLHTPQNSVLMHIVYSHPVNECLAAH